jgi:hypothetical protein
MQRTREHVQVDAGEHADKSVRIVPPQPWIGLHLLTGDEFETMFRFRNLAAA